MRYNDKLKEKQKLKKLSKLSNIYAGVYFDEDAGYYKRYSCNRKWAKKNSARKIRRMKNFEDVTDGARYRKQSEYKWMIT